MTKAWRTAVVDLGIRLESPFMVEHQGQIYWCSGWLPDFGSAAGTIITSPEAVDDILEVCEAAGYFTSALSPHYYERYERERFVETLNDWGWYGDPTRPPSWFTGWIHGHKEGCPTRALRRTASDL
ncbi:MAG: hypothetical protein QOI66_208 [Myxococcales bacterium]|nr:hypothetical protein [Myxococcales bacterium]